MRRSVNEANMGLRQSLKTVERGGVATLAQGMQQAGGLQAVEVTTLDPSDADVVAGAGLSAGIKLPVKVETRAFRFFCRQLVHTQAAWDALSDAMKDKTIIVTQDDAPIGSEAKCFECDAAGNVVGSSTWVMGPNGWFQDGFTPSPDGSTLLADAPIVAPNSISSFLPGQTAGVPDTASLTINAGVSQRVALPNGDAFRFDFSGFGPFALRFGTSSVAAVATDFPGIVGLPIYYRKPEGATHVAVYGIGAGSVVVSGGTTP